jgi:hypothetical protein
MTNVDVIESVISILAVDGKVNHKKMQFFNDLCQRLEVPRESVSAVLYKARQGKGRIHLPDQEADKKRLLYFLAQAVVVDGDFGANERQIMNAVVDRMRIPREYLERFIQLQLKDIAESQFSPISAKPQMTCPKCGHDQPVAPECRRCGVIFERYKKTQEPDDAEKLREMLSGTNVFKRKK